jgi:hypothetical protein
MYDCNFIQGFLGVQIKLTNVAGADWDTRVELLLDPNLKTRVDLLP